MINPVVFSSNWEMMNRHYRHNCSENIMRIYYDYLSPRMTTEEFVRAMEQIFVDENYFPSATNIAQKIHGSPKAIATMEWEVIIEAAKQGKPPELCDCSEKALWSIGGRYVIEQANTYRELPHLRRQFIEAYQSYAEIEDRSRLIGYRERAEAMLQEGDENAA